MSVDEWRRNAACDIKTLRDAWLFPRLGSEGIATVSDQCRLGPAPRPE